MVKPSAAKYLDGEPVFDPSDVAFYVLPEDVNDGAVITPIDMTLRTAEHNTGIQDQLNILSSKCGFGETYYRFDGGSVATATQVISENSTMFRTIKSMRSSSKMHWWSCAAFFSAWVTPRWVPG